MRRENGSRRKTPPKTKEDKEMKTDTIQTRNRITTCLLALLTFCLVLAGVFFIAPIEAEAAVGDTFTVDNIIYRVLTEEEGNYTVEVLDEALTEETAVTIPATVSNGTHTYSVTAIAKDAFWRCDDLTGITIPEGVTSIGKQAFSGCTNLTSIPLPESLETIDEQAFEYCYGLESITIPAGVSSISRYTFYRCNSLTSIIISEGVTAIETNAFGDCTALTGITIPNSVTSVAGTAFTGCSSLTSISVGSGHTSFSSANGDLYNKEGTTLFIYAPGKQESAFEVASTVTAIGDYAFSYCTSLESITIPSSLTSIGSNAFSYCTSLATVTIENGVSSIEDNAFRECTALESITIPESVTSIGESSFYKCTSLASVSLSANITSIGSSAFSQCSSLESIVIPNGVASILEGTFWGCTSLATVTIPNGVTYIGIDAFRACYALEAIELPDSINSIGNRAFANCTSLEYIEIPNGTSGFRELFPGCSSLKSVVFPESTTFLNGGMFTNCTALESIIIKTADCSFYNDVEIPTTATVYAIGGGTIETYCTESGYGFEALVEVSWNLYGGATELELPKGYYRKGDTITITPALWESLTLDNFTLVSISCDNGAPESEPTVYTKATDSSEDITITVSDSGLNFSVKWQGETITVGNLKYQLLTAYGETYTVKVVGAYYATTPANGSVDLVIPEKITYGGIEWTVTEIGANAFGGKEIFRSVVIPDTVVVLRNGCFGDTYNLETVTLPSAAIVERGAFTYGAMPALQYVYLTGESETLTLAPYAFDQSVMDITVMSAREGYVLTLYTDSEYTTKFSSDDFDYTKDNILYIKWTKRLVVPEEYSTQIYEQYESFRPFDIVLNFDGGASESLTVTADMVSDFSTEEVSYSSYRTPKATITYDGDTATFEYEVVYIEPTLTTNKYDLDGDGAMDEVYEITNESELKWFAMTVNDGSADLNAVLTNDISLTEDHIPIGVREITGYLREKIYAYSGMFDGRGYTVRNLYIFFEDMYSPQGYSFDNGLFGYTDGARISNVTVEGPCIQVEIGAYGYSPCTGGLIGYAKNTVINNCHVTTGDNTLSRDWNSTYIITKAQPSLGTTVRAGILFGWIKDCTVMNCSVTKQATTDYIQAWPSSDEVSISYRKDYDEQAGGIAAYASNSTIVNCYVCSINSFYGVYSGNYGGLVGHAYNLTIRNCYSSGKIIGQVAKSYTYVIDNVFSGSDVNVFSDYDAQNGTTVGNGWYQSGMSADATFTLREGQTAPYGQTTTLAALNWGASQIDGALAWEYGENGVTFVEPVVSSVSIPSEYQTQVYTVDNGLKPFTVTVSYEQGGQRTIEVTEDMVTGLNTESLTAAAQTATVTYGGKTATFTYTVITGYAYTVEHYQQNIEDDDYTIVSADTETLYGVGTTAAAAKDYTGFTAQTFEQTTIAEDGSTVVKIYYTRNSYTVTYDLQGGTIESDSVQTFKYMEWAAFNRHTPTKAGYTFVGYMAFWWLDGEDELLTTTAPESIDELVTDNYYAAWFNMRFEAVWAERQVESISIPTASQNQIYVIGGAFVPFNITVTYDNGETESVEVTEAMLSDFSTTSAVTNATATVTYTEGEVTKTATFTYSVTNGYAYTVKHYQENLDDDGYTLVEADTQTLYGTGTTAAVAKTYTGFTAQAVTQTTIAEDGSTVVEIRYTRNLYTITLHSENGLEDIVINFKYGEITYADLSEILTQNEPEREGYYLMYWTQSKPNYILGGQPPTNMPLPAYPIPVPITLKDGRITECVRWISSNNPLT